MVSDFEFLVSSRAIEKLIILPKTLLNFMHKKIVDLIEAPYFLSDDV